MTENLDILSSSTDQAAVIETARDSMRIQPLEEADRFQGIVLDEHQRLETVDLKELDWRLQQKQALHPSRKTGTVYVHDAESFLDYLDGHGSAETQVYADLATRKLVAVLNDHRPEPPENGVDRLDDIAENNGLQAGHRDHRVSLALIPSPQWTTWTTTDKTWMDQQTFAEHLEDNAIDIVDPSQADLLEVAQTLSGATNAEWKFGTRLDNGQVRFGYSETVGARAGENGDLDIPSKFTIGISPFIGSPAVEVEARFRYRVRSGQISLSYALLNADKLVDQTFLDYVAAVRDTTVHPVYLGRPE